MVVFGGVGSVFFVGGIDPTPRRPAREGEGYVLFHRGFGLRERGC